MAMKVQGGRMVPVANAAEASAIKAVDEQVNTSLRSLRAAQGALRQLFARQGPAAANADLNAAWQSLEQAESILEAARERTYRAMSTR